METEKGEKGGHFLINDEFPLTIIVTVASGDYHFSFKKMSQRVLGKEEY